MKSALFLIHLDDYVAHIDDKVHLYGMLKQLTTMISKMGADANTRELIKMGCTYGRMADDMFESWGIPKSYLIFADPDDLGYVAENELIAPEDAGFCECDGCCDTCCECCTDDDTITDDEDEDDIEDNEDEDDMEIDEEAFAEMMAALTTVVHQILGNDVSIHIEVK